MAYEPSLSLRLPQFPPLALGAIPPILIGLEQAVGAVIIKGLDKVRIPWLSHSVILIGIDIPVKLGGHLGPDLLFFTSHRQNDDGRGYEHDNQ